LSQITFHSQTEGRYDRHDLITWWDQEKVSQARVIVAGAGALGNEVLKLLALIGVGQITVIDFDVISPSNLARMVLFREQDIGRPKVQAAVERVQEINPQVEVRGVQGDLRFDLGLGDYRHAHLVFGCLDSVIARWALNRKCLQAGVEWIDGAISDYHGLVARYSPRAGACYECTFTPSTMERFNRRYSCPYGLLSSQAENKVPTTAVTTSAIAALQVQQALMMIHGLEAEALQPGERLMLYLKPFHLVKDRLPVNHECLAHSTLPKDIPGISCSAEMRLVEVFALARQWFPGVQALDLGYDFVTEFYCPACNEHQPVNRPKDKVYQDEARCPKCGQLREPATISLISIDSSETELKLSDLGIPPREILAFQQQDDRYFLQMMN
jgi:molybdopterin/thiamine biosynthesis adenylyltransferase